MIVLHKLLGAKGAIQKIAMSEKVSTDFAWDFADFIIKYNEELAKFDEVRNKAIKANISKVDGKDVVDQEGLQIELTKLFDKEIDIDVSFLVIEEVKKVEELSAGDIVTFKSLIE